MLLNLLQVGIGTVPTPKALSNLPTVQQGGIGQVISTLVTVLIAGAGIYSLFNFILAGYAFISAGDDPKKVSEAHARIYQTIIGLVVASGALVITGLVSQLFFGNATTLLNPVIPTFTTTTTP